MTPTDTVINIPNVNEIDESGGCCRGVLWNRFRAGTAGTLACIGTLVAAQVAPIPDWAWPILVGGSVACGIANTLSAFAWKDLPLRKTVMEQNRVIALLIAEIDTLKNRIKMPSAS